MAGDPYVPVHRSQAFLMCTMAGLVLTGAANFATYKAMFNAFGPANSYFVSQVLLPTSPCRLPSTGETDFPHHPLPPPYIHPLHNLKPLPRSDAPRA